MPSPEKPKTASKVRRQDFRIGTESIASGRVVRFELPVARTLSGTMLSLPIAVVHGAHPGPVIWLSAAIHGDELNGIPIVRRVIRELDAKTLRGTVIAVPTVNVFGLIEGSRYLPDRRDLNRSFPGSRRGSLASQLARLFLEEIVKHSDFGIDLHTAAAGRTNIPQIRCDIDHPETKQIALAFGAPITLHASLRDGSLREAARELGIPVLLYEAGEAGRFDQVAILAGVEGILRVMTSLDMIEGAASVGDTVISRSSTWVRARRSGFCEMRARPGGWVSEGEDIAVVFDSLGASESRVRAARPGIVIGCSTAATVYRGDAVAHIAEI